MKKLLVILFVLFGFISLQAEDIDVNKKPESEPPEDFKFPEYVVKTLDNGIKVYIVEDHEQPTVSINMMIPGGNSVDGIKAGLADFTTALMTKGTSEMTALQIAEALDGVGADVSVSASTDAIYISGSSLLKHMPLMMEIFSDVLLNPTFPEEELEKLRPQALAGIRQQRSNSGTIASNLAKKVVYGFDHPYAQNQTEESVKSITIEDIQNYYNTYLIPNEATISVVGDVDADDIVDELNDMLEGWEKSANAPEIIVPASNPAPYGVYFVPRKNSIQSSVVLAAPAIPISHPDYMTLDLVGSIVGGGFGSKLFRILREKHSFTYSPQGYLTSSKYANRFVAAAEVKGDKTDSSIIVIRNIFKELANDRQDKDYLNRIKKNTVGNFLMNFESSNFISSLIQGAEFYGIPIEQYKNFPEFVMSRTPTEIREISRKYISPEKAYIVLVGNPELEEKLKKYGQVFKYNLDLEPMSGKDAKMEKISMNADELIENYVEAIGGQDAINSVQDITLNSNITLHVQGQSIPGTYTIKNKMPNKYLMKMNAGPIKQEVTCNEDKVFAKGAGVEKELEGKEKKKMQLDFNLLKETRLIELGYQCKVLGKQGDHILMTAISPIESDLTYYYNADSYLIEKIEENIQTEQGTMIVTTEYSDYIQVDNLMLPGKTINTSQMFTIESENKYELNKGLDDSIFKISQ